MIFICKTNYSVKIKIYVSAQCKGVLSGIEPCLGLAVGDILDSQKLEDLEQGLAAVSEGHCTMVGYRF